MSACSHWSTVASVVSLVGVAPRATCRARRKRSRSRPRSTAAGFSPGVIDGRSGQQTRKAIQRIPGSERARGYRQARRRNAGALGRAERSDHDGDGHGGRGGRTVPRRFRSRCLRRRKLDGLCYSSVEEALAEKYHTTPAKLCAVSIPAPILPPAARSSCRRCGRRSSIGRRSRQMGRDAGPAERREIAARRREDRRRQVGPDRARLRCGGKLIAQFPAKHRQRTRSASVRRVANQRRRAAAAVPLQPGALLGCRCRRHEDEAAAGTERTRRRGLDRSLQGPLRHSRHARTRDDRAHAVAWLHPSDQLGRGEARPDGAFRHAGNPADSPCARQRSRSAGHGRGGACRRAVDFLEHQRGRRSVRQQQTTSICS